jgi:hypothetical protein
MNNKQANKSEARLTEWNPQNSYRASYLHDQWLKTGWGVYDKSSFIMWKNRRLFNNVMSIAQAIQHILYERMIKFGDLERNGTEVVVV